MNYYIQTDQLTQTVGHSVKSSNGEYLGEIARVARDETGKHIEYLILESNGFLDKGEHFFAIPASTTFIEFTKSKNIILRLTKEALFFARRIAFDKCPKPDLRNGASLYELI